MFEPSFTHLVLVLWLGYLLIELCFTLSTGCSSFYKLFLFFVDLFLCLFFISLQLRNQGFSFLSMVKIFSYTFALFKTLIEIIDLVLKTNNNQLVIVIRRLEIHQLLTLLVDLISQDSILFLCFLIHTFLLSESLALLPRFASIVPYELFTLSILFHQRCKP